jgi:hypothetical protein
MPMGRWDTLYVNDITNSKWSDFIFLSNFSRSEKENKRIIQTCGESDYLEKTGSPLPLNLICQKFRVTEWRDSQWKSRARSTTIPMPVHAAMRLVRPVFVPRRSSMTVLSGFYGSFLRQSTILTTHNESAWIMILFLSAFSLFNINLDWTIRLASQIRRIAWEFIYQSFSSVWIIFW